MDFFYAFSGKFLNVSFFQPKVRLKCLTVSGFLKSPTAQRPLYIPPFRQVAGFASHPLCNPYYL